MNTPRGSRRPPRPVAPDQVWAGLAPEQQQLIRAVMVQLAFDWVAARLTATAREGSHGHPDTD